MLRASGGGAAAAQRGDRGEDCAVVGRTADDEVALPEDELYQREITRAMFEQMVQPIVERTLGPCRQALKDAELDAGADRRSGAGGRIDADSAGAAAGGAAVRRASRTPS